MEKVNVEFSIPDGKREEFLNKLQQFDSMTDFSVGYRTDEYVAKRAALAKFQDAMELKLRENDHKTMWQNMPLEGLFRLLFLEIEHVKVYSEFKSADLRPSLVDVANWSLFLWDRTGGGNSQASEK